MFIVSTQRSRTIVKSGWSSCRSKNFEFEFGGRSTMTAGCVGSVNAFLTTENKLTEIDMFCAETSYNDAVPALSVNVLVY